MLIERNVSIPAICLVGSRLPAGPCQRFVYFDEFRARQDRMSPLGRPERRKASCLWFWFPSTPAASPPFPSLPLADPPPLFRRSERASLQMQIVSRTHFFFFLYAAPQATAERVFGSERRIISVEKLNEIYVRASVGRYLAGAYANATRQRPNRRSAIILSKGCPGILVLAMCQLEMRNRYTVRS